MRGEMTLARGNMQAEDRERREGASDVARSNAAVRPRSPVLMNESPPWSPSYPWAPSILFRDDNHVIMTYQRLFACIWRVETTAPAVKRVQRLVQEFASDLSPQRFCLLNVVEESSLAPLPAARAGLRHLLDLNTANVIRSAVVYEGAGFRAAAVFGVATGLSALTRHQFPHHVFADLGKATEWLAAGISSELGEASSGFLMSEGVRSARLVPPEGSANGTLG
jgi:hypothetical protein